jgi:regulator of protease activity HflC (stomatin/prohibitin superfamily)
MESALAWIGRIADTLISFFPTWTILNTTEGAVKFQTVRFRDLVRGKWDTTAKIVLLDPGLHVWWPVVSEIKSWVVARQPVDLPTQTFTTSDGRVIAVGGGLLFRIVDAEKLIADTWDPDKMIRIKSAGVFQDVCGRASYDELQMAKNDGRLVKELRRALRRRLRPFGVVVLDVSITDFAPARVYKLIQATSQDAA